MVCALENTPHKAQEAAPDSSGPALVEDDDSIGELQGVMHTDGKLYLVSPQRSLVFLSERSDDGKLQCVGEIFGTGSDTIIKLYNVQVVSKRQEFPYPTCPEDHCETPFEAYADIAGVLERLAQLIGKERKTFSIWDPFYCDGAVKRHFERLGFTNVYNVCEDFYQVVSCGNIPEYDCIVTNPPYSIERTDHIEELFKILCSQSRPWFVVQPNYVYTKPYWQTLTSEVLHKPRPFFLTPTTPRKYKYKSPSGIRQVASAQCLKTSPFVSMWYCWVGAKHTENIYRWIASQQTRGSISLSLACSEHFLPDCFKDSNDKTRRKKRKEDKKKKDYDINKRTQVVDSASSLISKKRKKKKHR